MLIIVYICCCPCCYKCVVKSKIKSEHSHIHCKERVPFCERMYRKFCICYEFSRKCPSIYILYLDCANCARICKAQTSETYDRTFVMKVCVEMYVYFVKKEKTELRLIL